MASKPLIARIPTSPVLFQPSPPDFAGYTQKTLGDLGTGSDGWDAAFAPIATAIDQDTAGLSHFDDLINEAAFNTGDFGRANFDPIDAILPGVLSDGDALNTTVQNPGAPSGDPAVGSIPDPPVVQPIEEPPPDPAPDPYYFYPNYPYGYGILNDYWYWWN